MCWMLAVGAAMAVAGTIAKQQGDAQAAKARDDATMAEQQQQAGLQKQGQSYYDAISSNFDPSTQKATQDTATENRTAASATAMAPTVGTSSTDGMNPNAPRIVADTANAYAANNKSIANDEASGAARMGSFGDLMMGNQVQLGRAGQNIDKIASFAHGDANLLPLQLQDANQKGAPLRSFGSLLTSVGGMMAGAKMPTKTPKPAVTSGISGAGWPGAGGAQDIPSTDPNAWSSAPSTYNF